MVENPFPRIVCSGVNKGGDGGSVEDGQPMLAPLQHIDV